MRLFKMIEDIKKQLEAVAETEETVKERVIETEETVKEKVIETEETVKEKVIETEARIEHMERSVRNHTGQICVFIDWKRKNVFPPEADNLIIEREMLAECDIRQLFAKLEELAEVGEECCIIGNIAGGNLKEIDQAENKKKVQNWNKGEEDCKRLFLLDMKSAYQFIEDERLKDNTTRIKDSLVFLMPCAEDNSFQVIWDKGFGETEIDGDSCWRWFVGEDHVGRIIVYNSFECYKLIRLCFESYTANPKARIIVRCGEYVQMLDMSRDEHAFDIDTILAPGCNELELIFCGEICNLAESEKRKCQFTVTNFRIFDMEKDIWYSGERNYSEQFESCCARYLMSDYHIRSRLHESGFFEIEAYVCGMEGITPLETTRAYVAYGGYYPLGKVSELHRRATTPVLYIARRRGKIKDEE